MLDYFDEDHGSYLALPYSKRQEKGELSSMFKVEGIPTLAIVDAEGRLVNADASSKISAGAEAVLQEGWAAPAVGDMAQGPEAAGTDINECPAIVIMCEDADEATQKDIEKAMEPLAKKYIEKAKLADADEPDYIFLIAKGGGPIEQLKELTQKDAGDAMKAAADAKKPTMLLFDIPDNGGFYVADMQQGQITTDSIAAFIQSKEAGQVKRMQLGR